MTSHTSSPDLGQSIVIGNQSVPVKDVRSKGAKAASGFRALGLKAGDTIALLLRNDVAFLEAQIAAGLVGVYVVPINWHSTAEEAGYILRDCNAAALVVHSDLLPTVEPGLPHDVIVLVVPTPEEIRAAYHLPEASRVVTAGRLDWNDWLNGHAALEGTPPPPPAAMIYTSGTTGRPKGVRREPPTTEQFAQALANHAKTYGLSPAQPIVALMTGPLYHSAPNAYARSALHCGATIVFQARFDAEDVLRLIEQHHVTHIYTVPTMFVRLLKLPEEARKRYDVSSLRFVVHGAAPCAPSVKRAMIEWWGPVINEIYGATEVGITVWHDSQAALAKPGTVGQILEGATVKAFSDTGEELPTGQVGELYMRAHWLPEFTYHGQDERRREASRGDLVTIGDIGWIDEDGFVFLCDRKRDMVISGGVNIYPAEIESVLVGMDGVKDCAVFGIPDEEFGESLCAHVEPDPAGVRPPTAEAIRSYLAAHVARYKIPKIVEIVANLPRQDSGKIFKRKLRAPYWEKVGRSI